MVEELPQENIQKKQEEEKQKEIEPSVLPIEATQPEKEEKQEPHHHSIKEDLEELQKQVKE